MRELTDWQREWLEDDNNILIVMSTGEIRKAYAYYADPAKWPRIGPDRVVGAITHA